MYGLSDDRIVAGLGEFFKYDWDINGVITEWDIMAYYYRHKSTNNKNWFGQYKDWFGNYFV